MTPLSNFVSASYEHIPPRWMEPLATLATGNTDELYKIVELMFPNAEKHTKGMVKIAHSLLNTPTNLSLCYLVSILSKANFNHDKLIQILDFCKVTPEIDEAKNLRVKDINLLRKTYNDNRIFRLLTEASLTGLRDTMDMMNLIHERHPTLSYLPKKPKDIHHLHESCLRTLPKVGQKDYDLQQREDILMLDGKEMDNGLTLRVPKRHFDLVDLGEVLGFCIGNGAYSRKVFERKSSIVALFDKKGPVYGIEFSRYSILEAQGFGNLPKNRPSQDVLHAIQQLVLKTPELPSEFLPIADSGWVHGYRYTDKDLYLLLKDRIYIYADVPEEVYESLLDSDRKGTFVNRYIKPNYDCEFVGYAEAS
jgi:hypothetical protein